MNMKINISSYSRLLHDHASIASSSSQHKSCCCLDNCEDPHEKNPDDRGRFRGSSSAAGWFCWGSSGSESTAIGISRFPRILRLGLDLNLCIRHSNISRKVNKPASARIQSILLSFDHVVSTTTSTTSTVPITNQGPVAFSSTITGG